MNKNKISSRIFILIIALAMIFSVVKITSFNSFAEEENISDNLGLETLLTEKSELEILEPEENNLEILEADINEAQTTEELIEVDQKDGDVTSLQEAEEILPTLDENIIDETIIDENEEQILQDDQVDLTPEINTEIETDKKSNENIDHLKEPDDSSGGGEIDYNVYPETMFPSTKIKGLTRMSSPVIGTDHPTDPGEVMLFKEAKPISGKVNTWEVTLRVEGKNKPTTSDIILVIDTSGSMKDHGRMKAAKDAANAFIDKLLPSTTTRIGIVSFDYYATVKSQLTNNAQSLKTAVNGLSADGGTFTQAAIKQAQAMLANSTAQYKNIVLLSDGVPTYSYELKNPDSYLSQQYIEEASSFDSGWLHDVYGNRWATEIITSESAYKDTRIGAGTAMFHRYDNPIWNTNDKYYNHGNSAISQAGFAKTDGYRLWTVGLSLDNTGRGVLQNMASPNSYYSAEPSDLEKIFKDIAGQIGSAVKDATVIDPMGAGFTIPADKVSQIYVSHGSVTYENNEISWNTGSLSDPISRGSDIYYAELKYTIEITDDILNETVDENGEYPTNGDAKISYTDYEGNIQIKPFPVPRVNPVLYKVVKVVQDQYGNEQVVDENFNIQISGPWTSNTNTNRQFVLNPNDTSNMGLRTDLRNVGTYSVIETGDLEDYDVSYYINGVESTDPKFVIVNSNTEDVEIKVVNRLKADVEVKIKKEVTGNFGELERKFSFKVRINEEDPIDFELSNNEIYDLIGAKVGDKITLSEEYLQYYEVTVKVGETEINQTDGKYIINLSDFGNENISIIVNNNRDVDIDTGIKTNDNTMLNVLIISTLAMGIVLIRRKRLN